LDEVVKLTDASLDEFFELSEVLSLIGAITISSSIAIVGHKFECIELIEVVEMCIFAKSLMGTII